MSVSIPYRIVALIQERNRLFAYPTGDLVDEIRAAGFQCDRCGACCTRAVNRHIFLLDHDVAELKRIDPSAYEPAPGPEFCDQSGTFYVSGYAIRMKNDPMGSCWFLENGKCRIYDQRFSGCRIYPHMLRRSTVLPGHAEWRQFARENEHGHHDPDISYDECVAIAREVREYENAYLTQQISFLETIHDFFTVHTLRHDTGMYKRGMERFHRGRPIDIRVFDAGDLEEYRIIAPEFSP